MAAYIQSCPSRRFHQRYALDVEPKTQILTLRTGEQCLRLEVHPPRRFRVREDDTKLDYGLRRPPVPSPVMPGGHYAGARHVMNHWSAERDYEDGSRRNERKGSCSPDAAAASELKLVFRRATA